MFFRYFLGALLPLMAYISGSLTDPRLGCEPEWFRLKSVKCYKVHDPNGEATLKEAQAICQNIYRAQVLTIQTQEQQSFVTELLNQINNIGIIIGARRTGPVTFQWIDGSPVRYSVWAAGEPNGGASNEDCVALHKMPPLTGKWNDIPCYTQLPFICEKGLSATNSSSSLPNRPEGERLSTLLIIVGVLGATFISTSILMCVAFCVFTRMRRRKSGRQPTGATTDAKLGSSPLYENPGAARYLTYNEGPTFDVIYEAIEESEPQPNIGLLLHPKDNVNANRPSYVEVVPPLPPRLYADVQ